MTPPVRATAQRRDRTDVVRNRERLLTAARAVFAEEGADAPLKSVAGRAELGVGTIYRHFATPQALVEAVLSEYFAELQDLAEQLAGASEPEQSLGAWLRAFVTCLTEYRGLARITMAQLQDPDSALYRSCHQMRSAAADLLTAAQRAGVVRTDLDINALLNLANAVALAIEQRPDQSALALTVLINGIRPD